MYLWQLLRRDFSLLVIDAKIRQAIEVEMDRNIDTQFIVIVEINVIIF